MSFPDITPDLKAAMPDLRGRLLANQSLADLTWFRVGGPAQLLFTPSNEDDLAYFLKSLPKELPVYVVGVGSNLIVRDGGMPGAVIRLAPVLPRSTSGLQRRRRPPALAGLNFSSAFPAPSVARYA
jgi:UDP-N-acetylmuramate dehydrogenase